MKKPLLLIITAIACIAPIFSACNMANGGYSKRQAEFYDLFDTYTSIIIYTKSGGEFEHYKNIIYDEMLRLHKLFDVYNDYEDIDNVKTINDNAGKKAVKVDNSIIELLLESKLAYAESSGTVNIAMGSVLKIWHEYREMGVNDPASATLPPMDKLKAANKHTNIADIVIDEKNSTVFLRDPEMSLDIGALAKGFAVQKAIDLAKESGMISGLINAGGNVVAVGKPMDGRREWSVGIQNPVIWTDGSESLIDTIKIADASVVTSGDYQRFYLIGDEAFHHIIDPNTLMPASRYSSVSVIHTDSGVADMLSTSIFILPLDQGELLIREYGAEAVWIQKYGDITASTGYKTISKFFSD